MISSYLTFDVARVIAWREGLLHSGDTCHGAHYMDGERNTYYGFEMKAQRKDRIENFGMIVNDNVDNAPELATEGFKYYSMKDYEAKIHNWTEIP